MTHVFGLLSRSLLPARAILALALLGALAHGKGSFQPIVDTPYAETVAHRYTLAGAPTVFGWGVLPWSKASQVVAGAVGSVEGAFVVDDADAIYFAVGPTAARILPVQASIGRSFRLLVGGDGQLRAAAQPKAFITLNCSMDVSSVACSVTSSQPFDFGLVNDAALVAHTESHTTAYVASLSGLYFVDGSIVQRLGSSVATLSVAYSPLLGLAAASTSDFVYTYTGSTLESQEWVTDLQHAWGGAYDGPAYAMAFDDSGVLYLANEVCVNVRYPNGTVDRLGWQQGLPVNRTRHVSVDKTSLWVGTDSGLAKLDFASSQWSYYYLQRYLPGNSVVLGLALSGLSTYVLTDGGMAVLETQMWTLARKADHYLQILLERHDRHGLVGGCDMASFGDLPSCACHDDDNNGLWTGVVTAALAFRYAVTGDPDAKNTALHFFGGMQLLNNITGIDGLMARSATQPGEQHGGGHWYFSNVTQYKNWQWKADTSSDEVVGHMFAMPLISRLVYATTDNPASRLVSSIVSYIARNNYYLIDATGRHTLWGVWNPHEINYGRNYSDERGVNSLQILAYLLQADYLTEGKQPLFMSAYRDLTNASNHYATNTINAKIESPDDDNYSDDELTFLPYYTLFTARAGPDDAVLRHGLQRTWRAVRSLRSDLWNAIYTAVDGSETTQADIDSIAWNLRTWPLELINWPVMNSHRRDLRFDIDADRFGSVNGDSVRVLPANERSQDRWNANPHDLDGGNGMSETDPGVWLLPYWLARYHGIIAD